MMHVFRINISPVFFLVVRWQRFSNCLSDYVRIAYLFHTSCDLLRMSIGFLKPLVFTGGPLLTFPCSYSLFSSPSPISLSLPPFFPSFLSSSLSSFVLFIPPSPNFLLYLPWLWRLGSLPSTLFYLLLPA